MNTLFALVCVAVLAFSMAENYDRRHKKAGTLGPAGVFSSIATTSPTTHNTTTPKPSTTTLPPTNHTTTLPPTNHTTTLPPTNHTTAPPTNHTTAPPTNHTTTLPPTNHTTAPPTNHTTAPPTNHTTTPTNHTTAPPTNHTTTPSPPLPTPPGNLTVGNYNIKDNKGVTCVLVNVALQLKVQYQNITSKNQTWGTFTVQPSETTTSGNCIDPKAQLKLTFKQGYVMFSFIKNTTSKSVYVDTVDVELSYPFPDGDPKQIISAKNESLELFKAQIGHSYSCKNTSVVVKPYLYLEASGQKLQAFNITKSSFGPVENCQADKSDYTVAIVVGIVLAILIIIVIIVYLLGRRKRTDGYQAL
ncbi:macrosialin [Amia ocellicauda]|uniref:macrosialin n=1 Tax=Amia ocellicauda TaxID=2972642 RepID=UPI003464DBA8